MKKAIGIDLCDDGCTVSLYGEKKLFAVPTVICREKQEEIWHIGEAAYRATLSGKGTPTDKLLKLIEKDGASTISGRTYTGRELLTAFLKQVLQRAAGDPGAKIGALTVSLHKPKPVLMDAVRECLAASGVPAACIRMISHEEALIHYAMRQERDLYSNMIALFDLSDERLSYYELKVLRGGKQSVVCEGEDLEETFHIDILKNDSGRKLGDRIMCGVAGRLMDHKIFSAVFLTGKGFEHLDWAPAFKELICRRRRVIWEQGLFARGAANCAAELLSEEEMLPYRLLCDTRLGAELSMNVIANDRSSRLILAGAGDPWYGYHARAEFIPAGQDYVDIELEPLGSQGKKRLLRIPLEGFPKRPDRCTRVELAVETETAHKLRLSLADRGFGELFPASNARIDEEIEI